MIPVSPHNDCTHTKVGLQKVRGHNISLTFIYVLWHANTTYSAFIKGENTLEKTTCQSLNFASNKLDEWSCTLTTVPYYNHS